MTSSYEPSKAGESRNSDDDHYTMTIPINQMT